MWNDLSVFNTMSALYRERLRAVIFSHILLECTVTEAFSQGFVYSSLVLSDLRNARNRQIFFGRISGKGYHHPHLLFSKCPKIREDFSYTRAFPHAGQNSSNSNSSSYDYRLTTTSLRIAQEKPLIIHSISSQGTSPSFPNLPLTTVQSQNSSLEAFPRSSALNGRGARRMPDGINKKERTLWAKRTGTENAT
jgi:hypothetical protein